MAISVYPQAIFAKATVTRRDGHASACGQYRIFYTHRHWLFIGAPYTNMITSILRETVAWFFFFIDGYGYIDAG